MLKPYHFWSKQSHLEVSMVLCTQECPPKSGNILKLKRVCVPGNIAAFWLTKPKMPERPQSAWIAKTSKICQDLQKGPRGSRIAESPGPREVRTTLCTQKCWQPRELRWYPNVSVELPMSTADTMPAYAFNIRIPSPNSAQWGFDTECGNSEGNARSPVNLE